MQLLTTFFGRWKQKKTINFFELFPVWIVVRKACELLD